MTLNITWNTQAVVSTTRRGFAPHTVGGTAAGAVVGAVVGGMTGLGTPAQVAGAVVGGLGGGYIGSEVAATAPARAGARAEAIGAGLVRGAAHEAGSQWQSYQAAQAQQASQASQAALPGQVQALEQGQATLFQGIRMISDKLDRLQLPAQPAPAAQPAP